MLDISNFVFNETEMWFAIFPWVTKGSFTMYTCIILAAMHKNQIFRAFHCPCFKGTD